MAIKVKIMEKHAGTLTKTARAWLGGLITSESSGYAGTNCTISQSSNPHMWNVTATSGTYCYMYYDTAVPCVEGNLIYIEGFLRGYEYSDQESLHIGGTTGGDIEVITSGEMGGGQLYGVAALTSACTGNIRLMWRFDRAAGPPPASYLIENWTAIDTTAQFGAGDEPSGEELRNFFGWRELVKTSHKCDGLFDAVGNGDRFHFASKVAAHGLRYNDIIGYNDEYFSPVYPLNEDWIVSSCYRHSASVVVGDITGETDCPSYEYWTKIDYSSRVLSKTLRVNLREDIDGSASMAFRGDSTWQPILGMTVAIVSWYDEYDEEELFVGHITKIDKTPINNTTGAANWRCDCEVSSLLSCLQWNVASESDLWIKGFGGTTTKSCLEYLLNKFIGPWVAADHGGQGLWISHIADGNSTCQLTNASHKTIYDLATSLCDSSGLVLTVTRDRRIVVRANTEIPAESSELDLDANPVMDVRYFEDMSQYGNEAVLRGGYDSGGKMVISYVTDTGEITNDIYAGKANKALIVTNSSISDSTDGETVGALYLNQYGKAVPGQLSFMYNIDDMGLYLPGTQLPVVYASMGISAKTMTVDSCEFYDSGGVYQCRIVCSSRDATDYISAPNKSDSGYLSDVSSKVNQSVSAITQDAGTFTPALAGSSTAGTWAYTTQDGYYVRHGNMCYISVKIVPSSITGSPSGNLTMTGLPFSAAANPDAFYMPVWSDGLGWGTSNTVAQFNVTNSATTGVFLGNYNNGAAANIDVASVTAGDDIRVAGWYQVTL